MDVGLEINSSHILMEGRSKYILFLDLYVL